ncbi:MAG TPA: Rieske 2Fe-2S domain-containing protein [Pirellulales bacterium]|nr:Rieske 2Fe-2S domain-containing protein [Pirellulales bacterium]
MAKHTDKVASGDPPSPAESQRRGFMTELTAIVVGGIVAVVPAAAGLVAFFDPVRRKSGQGAFIRVATVDSLAGEAPQFFQVIADKQDAWNLYPKEPLGGVYLRKTAEDQVECLSATCPHAGCNVDFVSAKSVFKCPCHNSSFEPDGTRIDPEHCPSPRDLDTLEVDQERLKQTREIFVKYRNFRTGSEAKVADE